MTPREARTAQFHFHIRQEDGVMQPQPYRSALAARAECVIGPTEIRGYKVVKVMRGRPCPCLKGGDAKQAVNTPNPVRQDGRRGYKAQDTPANLRQTTPAARTCNGNESMAHEETNHLQFISNGGIEG